MENNKHIIFLGHTSSDSREKKEEIYITLERADNIIVEGSNIAKTDESIYKELSKSECAVFILGKKYGETLPSDSQTSVVKYQYNHALKYFKETPDFKLVVWLPPIGDDMETENLQKVFINEVLNGILPGMIFTNTSSPIQLVDDIRSILKKQSKLEFPIHETEVFLIFNQIDENEADDIIELLSDIVSIEKLNIIQDTDIDYSEFCFQQIDKSKIAVVYFKESAEWALPFAQQVWKKVGGASSHTPILFIGDQDPSSNLNINFNAPRVISMIVSGEIIPLEIKVNLDKVIESNI